MAEKKSRKKPSSTPKKVRRPSPSKAAPQAPKRKAAKVPVPRTASPKGAKKKQVQASQRTARPKVTAAAAAEPRVSSPARNKQTVPETLPREFLFGLADAIRKAVAPAALAMKGREIVSTATSGDATFELDRLGEKALLGYLRSQRAPVAYYSEDAGYSTFSNEQPKFLLIIDPIDGTRAAKSGFEGCAISIACTRVIERPTMATVESGCVMELLGGRTFYAERGKGAKVYVEGRPRRPQLSENADLELLTWSMTVPARPAELIFPTAARLIDLSSLKGGFFACNSTSYSLTRLLTGQQDACVDIASRYLQDIPAVVRDQFINAGRGNVIGIAPYDMAAALLIASEAGCVVTDAFGKGFDDLLLLDSSENNQQTLIAASNPILHKKLLSYFDMRIRQYERLLSRHARAKN